MSTDTDETHQVKNSSTTCRCYILEIKLRWDLSLSIYMWRHCADWNERGWTVWISEAEGGRPLHCGSHLSEDRRGAGEGVQQANHRCDRRDGGPTVWWVAAQFNSIQVYMCSTIQHEVIRSALHRQLNQQSINTIQYNRGKDNEI